MGESPIIERHSLGNSAFKVLNLCRNVFKLALDKTFQSKCPQLNIHYLKINIQYGQVLIKN